MAGNPFAKGGDSKKPPFGKSSGGSGSKPPFGKGGSSSKDSSSDTSTGGLRFKTDPSLPAGQRAIVDGAGKRVGVVKKIGAKWAGSWDNYKQQFDSPVAALKHLAMTKKLGKGGSDTKPGAVAAATNKSSSK